MNIQIANQIKDLKAKVGATVCPYRLISGLEKTFAFLFSTSNEAFEIGGYDFDLSTPKSLW